MTDFQTWASKTTIADFIAWAKAPGHWVIAKYAKHFYAMCMSRHDNEKEALRERVKDE